MANPVFVDCPAAAWTKVATNVTIGSMHKIFEEPFEYYQTYKNTGDAAPTLRSEGAVAFEHSRSEPIKNNSAIDVYIWPDTALGRVRVDL